MYKGSSCVIVIVFLCVRAEYLNSSGSSLLLPKTGFQFLSICSVLLEFWEKDGCIVGIFLRWAKRLLSL